MIGRGKRGRTGGQRAVAQHVLQRIRPRDCRTRDYIDPNEDEQPDLLTSRELDVLKLIADAQTSKQIAEQLVIGVKTVERRRQNILDKLGLRDRAELTRYAIPRGLIQA